MKKVLVMMASLFQSSHQYELNADRTALYDSFTDTIISIKDEIDRVVVQFTRSEAYSMSKSNPNYIELSAKLEKLKKEEKKVKIVAIIPMMEIKEITE